MEKKSKSYRDLEIYRWSKKLAVEIHRMALKEIFKDLLQRYEELGAKLFNFREAVIEGHRTS